MRVEFLFLGVFWVFMRGGGWMCGIVANDLESLSAFVSFGWEPPSDLPPGVTLAA